MRGAPPDRPCSPARHPLRRLEPAAAFARAPATPLVLLAEVSPGPLTVTGGALERDFLQALDPAEQQQLHDMLVALMLPDRPESRP